jgi:hypothetical protein
MRAPLLLPFAVLALAACDHSSSGSATPSGSSSAAASAASAAPADSAGGAPAGSASADPPVEGGSKYGLGDPPRLADADVETLQKGLKCTAVSALKAGPCKILAAMEKCADWNPVATSGDGRYIGHGWQVAGATTTDIVTILRSHTVPQSDLKPWQLPVKISTDSIAKGAGPAFTQADRVITALSHHEAAPAKNAAVDLLKTKSDWKDEAPAAKTMGSMIEMFSERPTYACQGPAKQIVLVQQDGSDVGVKSDGLYAELWPASL